MGVKCLIRALLCGAVHSVPSGFAIISLRKSNLVALLYFSSCCRVAVGVLWRLLVRSASWVGL